ncbi:MAG: ribbon-helix-helix domain-containing protein [archaeon GBS-70-058]|nr:ribbon-helix-helix domain-containing protein [Candidatus Culexarchaeum nevadense]
MRSIRISIPEDMLRDIDLLIKIGHYNSRDEVIAKALNDLLSREFVRISRSRYVVKS